MGIEPLDTTAPDAQLALVVDDEATSRILLKGLLERLGYRAIVARDGEEGLAMFIAQQPSIVFVDVLMPGISGVETAWRIKAAAGERFVPVIFLTAVTDEATLAECLQAGGDDFLNKPVSRVLLKAKIHAARRTANLYQALQRQQQQLLYEQELAKQVYAKTVSVDPNSLTDVRCLQRPASVFSGDILLAARSPTGALHVLLGDFTGHGLAAAIGAMPAAEVFRGMTAKGFTVGEILAEINDKLRSALPTGMFLAAAIVSISADGRSANICNSGLPELLVLSRQGRIRQRIASTAVPLGIIPSNRAQQPVWLELAPGDQIVALTDGIIEARNPAGEQFTDSRLAANLEGGEPATAFDRVIAALDDFIEGMPQDDDITLSVIAAQAYTASASAYPETPVSSVGIDSRAVSQDEWSFATELFPPVLRRLDIVPLIVGKVVELQGLRDKRQTLFTIFSELLGRAIDEGLLGMDNRAVSSPEGQTAFFRERAQLLEELENGSIRLNLGARTWGEGGELDIRVEYSCRDHRECSCHGVHHPGANPLRRLCAVLEEENDGKTVHAVYRW